MTAKPWRTLARRTLLDRSPWLSVGVESVELPSGRVIDEFHWIAMPDYVVVVGTTADGRIVCERMYKHGPRALTWELPAGIVSPGEDPADAARRELLEETGYEAEEWRALGSFTVNSNYGANVQHVFAASGARSVAAPAPTDAEECDVFLASPAEFAAAIRAGEVRLLSAASAFALSQLSQPVRRERG